MTLRRNQFLGEMLSTLFDRNGRIPGKSDARNIYDLCRALLSAEGDISGVKLAATILQKYRAMSIQEKQAFFTFLNDELDLDVEALEACIADYGNDRTSQAFVALSKTAEPIRQELLRRLNQPMGATAELVAMRVDLRRILKDRPELARTDYDFAHLLRSWFNRGFLVIRTIDWDTPASILDKIVAYEAVHQISDFADLRRRLDPPDRRCFAFFHPAMPDEPLIFVEVALTDAIPGSVTQLLTEGRTPLDIDAANTAVFYSISNCQKGLHGISFGGQLIKQVVAELSRALPNLQNFVTLSPIPTLNRWLATQIDDPEYGPTAAEILQGDASPQDIRAMAARYIVLAKNDKGMPPDPVARFHLGNGAQVFEIHSDADTSVNGRKLSSGAMVNYLYDLSQTQHRHEEFALKSIVATSKSAQALSTAKLSTKGN